MHSLICANAAQAVLPVACTISAWRLHAMHDACMPIYGWNLKKNKSLANVLTFSSSVNSKKEV